MSKYAIVGFGCAGYHAAEAIRRRDAEGVIDVYSAHAEAPYNPMLTTYRAAGKLPRAAMFPFGELESVKSRLRLNVFERTPAEGLAAASREVILKNGERRAYDAILVSTGARPFAPPAPGIGGEDIFFMRTQRDSDALYERLQSDPPKTAVVIGASMVGIKVVELLNSAGVKTTLADMAPYIFPLAAYPDVARAIERRVLSRGVELAFGKGLQKIEHREGTHFVGLSDGSELQADIILLCIGARANTGLIDPAEVKMNRGVVVDAGMRTSAPGIFAAGDCCEGADLQSHDNKIIGLWANAGYQGRTAGANMAGGSESFRGNILHNITHFMDMDFIGMGDNRLAGEELCCGKLDGGLYVKAIMSGGRPVGVNILGSCRVGGALKSYFVRRMCGDTEALPPLQRDALAREGLTQSFLDRLEGRSDD